MRALLDTHVWLWMLTDPERLGGVRQLIEDAGTELMLSAASSWEISIKYSIGRLALPEPPNAYLPERIRSSGVVPLAIEHWHVSLVSELPFHHRDPFGRLLVAQAQSLQVPLLTADSAFDRYAVRVIRVG